jgi:drug/metabolite transporter (DMT)-like permease
MLYSIAAVFCASLEMLLLGHAITFINMFMFLPFFYFFSTSIFLSVINPFSTNNKKIITKYKKHLSIYVVTGAIGNFFWFYGVFLMGVSSAVVVAILHRFFIMFYGVIKLKEVMSKTQILISSIVILCTIAFASDADYTEKTGLLFCALSYAFYAISDITQKKLSNEVSWKIALILRQSFQFFMFTLICVIYFGGITEFINNINQTLIVWSACLAFIGGFLSKTFHFMGVKTIPLSRVVIIEQSKPVLVLFGGYFVLQESITQIQFIAALIILTLTILFFSKEKKQ